MTEQEIPVTTTRPDPSNLTRGQLELLRLAKGGDIFRNRPNGPRGKLLRLKQLEALKAIDLVRTTREGLWRTTAKGDKVLEANPARRRIKPS